MKNDIVLCSDCFPNFANHVTYSLAPFSPCVECGRHDKSLNKKYKADCYWFVNDPRKYGVIQRSICKYLQWRYGKAIYELKPPLGWCKYNQKPLWYKIKYFFFLKLRWVLESAIFRRYGKPLRNNWLANIYGEEK